MTTLVLSSRHTADNQALWRAAIQRKWNVVRTQGIRLPTISDEEIVLYVEALFAPTIADQLGRSLMEIDEDWLTTLPREYVGRSIELTRLGIAREIRNPMFVKPPNDKSFAAKVYRSGDELPSDYDDEMAVLISSPVIWKKEFRCFCLDGNVLTVSPYLSDGVLARLDNFEMSESERSTAIQLAEDVLSVCKQNTPKAVVIDVGEIKGNGWAVVEANAAWGSGIYGCDPNQVLEVIRNAVQVK